MKWTGSLVAIVMVALGCGGKLSDEQRQRIREDMKEGEIRKVTDAAFMEAAFRYGRELKNEIDKQDPYLENPAFVDSLSTAFGIVIKTLKSPDGLGAIERQIFEAYQGAPAASSDNVQKLPGDSVLFTWPLKTDGPVEQFSVGALRIPNKQIIRSIED